MRKRDLKPGFFKNPELVELPFEYRILFAGLWCIADREGRLEDRAKRIRMEVFPADDVDCEAGLHALAAKHQIVRYEAEGGAYIWIPGFADHQHPHPREVASTIPPYLGGTQSLKQDDLFTPTTDPGNTQERCSRAGSSGSSGSSGPSGSGSTSARGTRLADDWAPTAEQLLWARQDQPTWTEAHALRVADSFRDHWKAQAGAKGVKLDWDATWRNWVRREGPMKGASSANGAWSKTEASIVAKGRELGIERRPDETASSFRDRIRTRLESRA